MRAGLVLVVAVSTALFAADPAAALFQVNAFSGPRVWDEVASIPLGIAPVTKTVTFRADGKTYRGIWANYSFRYPSTTYALNYAYSESRRSDAENGVFVDRPLTRTERRRFFEVADLYHEADVLVLAGSNAACSGLTRAQAHGIATGRYRNWSQVGGGSRDIHVRYLLDEAGGPEPRLGTLKPSGKVSYAPGARAAPDGGVSLAAGGDASIAAVTTWSLARRGVGSACVVPLGGVAPSDASVRSLRYPEAFAVRYVFPRRPARTGYGRHLRAEVGKYLRSARLKTKLLAKGLLVTGRAAPVAGPQAPSVTTPKSGRSGPISAARDDAALKAVIGGLLLEVLAADGTSQRLVFEEGGVLRRQYVDKTGFCNRQMSGHWSLLAGWRYGEFGGGLIARVGWELADPESARTVEIPTGGEVAYVDGTEYRRLHTAAPACGVPPAG